MPKQVFGLPNIGNSCYLNSVVQMLMTIDDLNDDILDIHTTDPFIFAYKKLISNTKLSNTESVYNDFVDFKNRFNTNSDILAYKDDKTSQEDAHEALLSILTLLRNHTKKIETLFKFSTIVQLICCNCDFTTNTKDIFVSFSIPFDSQLNQFNMKKPFEPEYIESHKCDRCMTNSSVRQEFIYEPPVFFIITLNRFDNNKKKIETEYNHKKILMVSSRYGEMKYNLKSIIFHSGSTTTSGHYTIAIRIGETWKCIDDNVIRDITYSNTSTTSYLFLYERASR